jgi:hypothetical protein
LSDSGFATTTNANDLLIGSNWVASGTPSAGTGYTSRQISGYDGDILEDQIVGVVGSYNATAPVSPSAGWIMQMAAFKGVASGGGGDTTPPGAPSAVNTSVASSTQINLTWSASTDNVGVTGYQLQSCAGAGCTNFTPLGSPITTTSYSVTGLTAGTPYTFRISALDAAGNVSSYTIFQTTATPTASGSISSVTYDYDSLGRVVQAEMPALSSVQSYRYDAAGNIVSSNLTALTTLSIGGLSASQGATGTQITIYGSGFLTTPSQDVVKINGVSATVVSATGTQLVVSIPSGATTGNLTVTTGGTTVTSPTPFTVIPAIAAPTITSFTPTLGAPGATLTITGTNFDSMAVNNKIQFGSTGFTSATARTTTTLATRIPQKGAWGKVRVLTPKGQAVSTADFFSPPTGYTVSTIGSTGRLTVGTPGVVTIGTGGQSSMQIFDGAAGDLLTIKATNDSVASLTLKVFSPDGSLLTSGTVTASGQGLQIRPLPRAGTYALIADPGANTGAATLTVLGPVQGTLTIGGPTQTFNLAAPGQRALATFSGTTGQYTTLAVTANTIASSTLTILKPDGTQLVAAPVTSSTTGVQLPQLPASGTYTIVVDPGINSGSITLALPTPVTGSVSAGGAALPLNLTPTGQRGLVTFSGTAGQYLTVKAQGFVGTITVSTPSGTQLISGATTATAYALQLPVLPATGTYTMLFDPGSSSASFSLSLLTSVTGSGITGTVTLADPNARGVVTFTGSPGKYVAFTIQENDLSGGQIHTITGIQVTIVAPDGSVVNGTSLMGPPPQNPAYSFTCPGGLGGNCYGNTIINIGPLPTYAAGTTFTAVIQQTGGNGGTLSYTVSNPIVSTQTIVAGAPAQSYYLALAGQGMLIPISLTLGHGYSLTISESSRNIPLIYGLILNSSGQGVQGAGMTATCASPCTLGALNQYSGSESAGIGVGVGGSYTLLLQQATQTSGANAYGPLQGDLFIQLTQLN